MRLYIFMGDLKHEKQYEYSEKYLKKHNEYPAEFCTLEDGTATTLEAPLDDAEILTEMGELRPGDVLETVIRFQVRNGRLIPL